MAVTTTNHQIHREITLEDSRPRMSLSPLEEEKKDSLRDAATVPVPLEPKDIRSLSTITQILSELKI